MTNSIIHYSRNEVKHLSNRELLEHIMELNMPVKSMSKFIKNGHHIPLLDELISRTNFLDSALYEFVPILSRLYCIEHNINEHPRCQNPNCHNVVEWRNGLHRFAPYCSIKCRDSDPEFQTRKEQGMFLKHGVHNCMELDWVKDKVKQTTKERFGVEHATQSKEIQEKTKRTNEDRYGVSYVFQSEEFRKKSEATCKAKYGVKHPCQNPDILERQKQAFIENYGTHPMRTKEVVEKVKQTMMERHGVECAFQLDSVKQKLIESNVINHGVRSMLELSDVRELGHQKLFDDYGVNSPSELDWVKEKIRSAHLSDETVEKTKQTCQERYGFDWYQQSPEYHKKAHKRYTNPKYPDMTFATSWEFKVYDFLTENGIVFQYQPAIAIPYEYNGKTHYYHPDFKVGDRIVEVKGDQFFRINEETGKEEMFMPWRKPGMSDSEYSNACEKEEAKHQCMIANNVIILRNNEIKNLTFDLFQKW